MSFKDVAIKNLRYNASKYIAYFLCSAFSIASLFMFTTVIYNPQILDKLYGTTIYGLMKGSFYLLAVFCFFFIGFINSFFMKERNKELGLFLTLGMTKVDIFKIIILENVIIGLLSILLGIISGIIFSRIFFMIIIKIISLNIDYYINPICFILSIGIFAGIFIIICVQSLLYTKRLEISELLKENRKSEKMQSNKPMIGFIGVIMIIVSCILMYLTIVKAILERHVDMVGVFMLITLIGLYLCISYFSSALIFMIKNNSIKYLKNLINLKEIQYKFQGFKNIIYILSLSVMACIYFIGGAYSAKNLFPNTINMLYPYDIMYIEIDGINKIEQRKIDKIIEGSSTPLIDKKNIKFMLMDMEIVDKKESFWAKNVAIISESEANKLTGKIIDVQEGDALQCIYKKSSEYYTNKKNIKLRNENEEIYNLNYGGVNIVELLLNENQYINKSIIVLDERDYNNISAKNTIKSMGNVHLFKFNETKKTEKAYLEIFQELNKANISINEKNRWDIDRKFKIKEKGIEKLKPISKLKEYESSKAESNFMLFSVIFIGTIFFICSGVVLYFKVLSQVDYAKMRYKKLYRIGITDKEMKQVVSKELAYIFSIPTIIGSILGYVFLAIHSVETSNCIEILINIIPVVVSYLIIQSIFYYITKRKYLKKIMEVAL